MRLQEILEALGYLKRIAEALETLTNQDTAIAISKQISIERSNKNDVENQD